MKLKKPPHLKAGSSIALVAPAWSFDRGLFEQGRKFLESQTGVKTHILDSVFDKDGYYAGSDQRRLEELYHWLTHPGIEAVVAIRGGYGCARIYPELLKRLKKHRALKPKIVVGYSDLTVLLNGLHQDLGWSTFHGPVIVGRPFREPLGIESETFERALFSTKPLGKISHDNIGVLQPGRAKGKIVGGCLSLLVTSLGTSAEIDTDGKILFIEDVGEYPYRIDRMLTHLVQAGKFDRVKGVIFGQMHLCDPPKNAPDGPSALESIRYGVEKIVRKRKIPTLFDFPAGHGSTQITFPIGCEVELVASGKNPHVVFRESGVVKPK